jgi:hypothetical protein
MPTSEQPSTGVRVSVDSITYPDGTPLDVLDLDRGSIIIGKVTLPNSLTGSGQVRVYAQQIGGPPQLIGSDSLTFAPSAPPGEPGTSDHPWSVVVPAHSSVLPAPEPGPSVMYNVLAVFTHDQRTDIEIAVEKGPYQIA